MCVCTLLLSLVFSCMYYACLYSALACVIDTIYACVYVHWCLLSMPVCIRSLVPTIYACVYYLYVHWCLLSMPVCIMYTFTGAYYLWYYLLLASSPSACCFPGKLVSRKMILRSSFCSADLGTVATTLPCLSAD